MGHLNKLLLKMASTQQPEDDVPEEGSVVDYVYVEKLASAVDYLIENKDLVIKKAEGEMSYDEAPPEEEKEKEDSKDRLKAFFAKKRGDKKDENKETKSKDKPKDKSKDEEEASAEEEKEASFEAVVNKLRDNLKTKVALQKTDKSVSFVNQLISRLKVSYIEEEKRAEALEPEVSVEKTVETTETVVEETKETSEGGPTLASMLLAARGGSADNVEESVFGDVKTATSQDVSLSDLLKGSLLKKIGHTEVN